MADVDVEFDFENDLNTDVGQPAEAPSSMPASARKNYRQASCKTVLFNSSRIPTDRSHRNHTTSTADSLPSLASRALHERKWVRVSSPV